MRTSKCLPQEADYQIFLFFVLEKDHHNDCKSNLDCLNQRYCDYNSGSVDR